MNVVVVESPAKASTISNYLGSGFVVLASVGHVRDLLDKNGAVSPEANFDMIWSINDDGEKNLRAISRALEGSNHLYLATDPDREGEAIAWHVWDELNKRNLLEGISVERIVFTEINKNAVLQAMDNPRALDDDLIDAYRARRALDYLVGYTLSPILWRKLPGSKSAGRVQSVALRLICQREAEIEAFESREYWTVTANFTTDSGDELKARLTHLQGKKLEKFDLYNEIAAKKACDTVMTGQHAISSIEAKTTKRNPSPPFITSTLQQESSRKLSFSAKRTMTIAQQLYQGIELNGEHVGLITYMRTDGVHIAAHEVQQIRSAIKKNYGKHYIPNTARVYRSKAKNAQEAHEAIRPTDINRSPDVMRGILNDDQAKLYELIWKRAIASQMESAQIQQTAIIISPHDHSHRLRANGSVIAFDGFLHIYQEGKDEPNADDVDSRLPMVKKNQSLDLTQASPEQHFTEPPGRFSEASLVKELERLGIGRPSTYASIISVLQDRNYVRIDRRRFIPEDRGRIVTVFLENFFGRYVEYDFTAALETELDKISDGQLNWQNVLEDFWQKFKDAIDETSELRITQVIEVLDKVLEPHLFPTNDSGKNSRDCSSCSDGRLNLKLGKHGPFIGCTNYPTCRHTRPLNVGNDNDVEPKLLGTHPELKSEISLRKGPFGHYLQLGGSNQENGGKPKRISLPRNLAPDQLDLEIAIGLLSLPRTIGSHPEDGKTITAAIGRFGPYVKHDGKFKSLKREDDILSIGLNRAVVLLAEPNQRGSTVLRELGNHPDDGAPIFLKKGRYGPYVQHKKTNATLTKGLEEKTLTMDEAISLITSKLKKKKVSRKKKKVATSRTPKAKSSKK